MANEEHVEILTQGVRAWNKWREDNPDVMADLSDTILYEADLRMADLSGTNLSHADLSKADLLKANLSGADLFWADLSKADLVNADLSGADLSKADLSRTDLSGANLREANLFKADLRRANLREANLCGANLSEVDLFKVNLSEANLFKADLFKADLKQADLSGADLRKANLKQANLRKVNLRKVNLNEANLREADLRDANLSGADLSGADLNEADLSCANLKWANLSGAEFYEADLSGADLSGTNLSRARLTGTKLWGAVLAEANLQDADLRWCQLFRCNFTNAVLTGCKLYGTARDDWVIKGVKCSCIYFDEGGEVALPKGREFEEGEFEKMYASMPTIEYFFQDGFSPIDPVIMAQVVQAIQEKKPDFDIQIDSINARGLVPSMKFIIQKEEQKDAALEQVTTEYEGLVKQLKDEKDRYYDLLMAAMKAPRETKLIVATAGSIVATDGSTVKIEQHIHHCVELQKVISNEPKGSKSFGKIAKEKAMDIIGGATEDVAKGLVKEAGKKIVKLCIELGPVLTKTAAYLFFKSMQG